MTYIFILCAPWTCYVLKHQPCITHIVVVYLHVQWLEERYMAFTHVNIQTGYSLMKSTIQIDQLVQQAKKYNMKSLAITDEHVLYGVIPFYKKCKKAGIHPMIGMNVHVETSDGDRHICTVLAKNNEGYAHISRMSTFIQLHAESFISFEQFQTYMDENTICIYQSMGPFFTQFSETNTYEDIFAYIRTWQDLVGKENFYLGIQDHGSLEERRTTQHVRQLYDQYQVQAVAIQEVYYLHENDEEAYRCLRAMQAGQLLGERPSTARDKRRHFRTMAEMKELFTDVFPEAIEATQEIARQCHVQFDFEHVHMPSFPIPEGKDVDVFLRELCERGLHERFNKADPTVLARMNMELEIIQTMGFSDYFLIVADFIDYAKREGIAVGPGRGSAAGSLVAYLLGITNVDPIKHDLLFERFLNPERKSLPDIDVDFSDHRRDEVIEYVKNKYGKERVAQIITFGTYGPRSLVREIGKVIELNDQDEKFVLQHIPAQAHHSIVTYVKQSKELFSYIEQSQTLQKLFRYARVLEGLPRHTSTHAAGVVISKEPLTTYTPLTVGASGEYITQFAMNEIEAVGLLKMDFLGLRNLSLLERLQKMIERQTKKEFALEDIPEQDEATFAMLSKGLTAGVFQFESAGMTRVLETLEPTEFEDLVAVNALYRPGPMEYISTFIDRKNGTEKITYPHVDVAPILKQTYGVLVYQEQIIQLSHQIARLSYGEADILRRGISKKDHHLMGEMKQRFIEGCLINGYDDQVATQLFDWIVKFSNYGFNKSHSVAYSTIAYQLAYIKAHEPHVFFTCLLSSTNQGDQIDRYMKEAEALGITIAPPDINQSYFGYSLEGETIRMGLLSIKGIGYQIVQEIIDGRKEGKYKHLFDFSMRVSPKKVNRKSLITLIRAGAFDSTYNNRRSLLDSVDQALEQAILFKEFHEQPSLLEEQIDLRPQYADVEDMDLLEKLQDEKEFIGRYASSHPLEEVRPILRRKKYTPFKSFCPSSKRNQVISAGIVQSIRKIRTKRGDSMAFVTLSDEEAEAQGVIFPNVFRDVSNWLDEQEIVQMTGKVEERNGRIQYVISRIQQLDISTLKEEDPGILYVRLTHATDMDALHHIEQISHTYTGETPIIVYEERRKQSYQLASKYYVQVTKECLDAFKKQFGAGNVVFK